MAYQVMDGQEKDIYDSIVVKIRNEENLDAVVKKIEYKLIINRRVTESDKDFTVTSNVQIMNLR